MDNCKHIRNNVDQNIAYWSKHVKRRVNLINFDPAKYVQMIRWAFFEMQYYGDDKENGGSLSYVTNLAGN